MGGISTDNSPKVDISYSEVLWQWVSNLNIRIPGELVTILGSLPDTVIQQAW